MFPCMRLQIKEATEKFKYSGGSFLIYSLLILIPFSQTQTVELFMNTPRA
jgi:hypothetical protein